MTTHIQYIDEKWKSLRATFYLLIAEIMNFYVLEVLAEKVGTGMEFFSRKKFQRDVIENKAFHEAKFAAAIFDYLCLALGGEARWARDRSYFFFPELLDDEKSRSSAQKWIVRFSPDEFLPALEDLFSREWRGGSYGGRSWAKIAAAARMYGNIPNTVFIDHCIDLKHNSGLAFDKEIIFLLYRPSPLSFDKFLYCKSNKDIGYWDDLVLDVRVKRLLERAVALGYIASAPSSMTTQSVIGVRIVSLFDSPYEPIVWGKKKLGEMVPTGKVYRCRDDLEDEEEDEDEDDYSYEDECIHQSPPSVTLPSVTFSDTRGISIKAGTSVKAETSIESGAGIKVKVAEFSTGNINSYLDDFSTATNTAADSLAALVQGFQPWENDIPF